MEDFTKEFTEGSDWRQLIVGGMQGIATGTMAEIDKVVSGFINTESKYNTELSQKIEDLDNKLKIVDLESTFEDATKAVDDMKQAILELIDTVEAIPNVERTITYKAVYEGDGDVSPAKKADTKSVNFSTNGPVIGIDNEKQLSGGIFNDAKEADSYINASGDGEISLRAIEDLKKDSKYFNGYYIVKGDTILGGPYENNGEAQNKQVSLFKSGEQDTEIITGEELFDKIEFDELSKVKKYANGGIVDYTGPAWVDGTPTNPEAFLSVEDTRNIQTLTNILGSILAPTSSPSSVEKSEVKSGDTNIEIHIDVEQISDDYDVDQMLDVIQQRISEASEGNVTIVK